MALFRDPPEFIWSVDPDGLAIRFGSERGLAKARAGRGSENEQVGFIRMKMLAESGTAREVNEGIFLSTSTAVALDPETREGFLLPPSWPGGMRLTTQSVPTLNNFNARLGLVEPGSDIVWNWKLRGPILEVLSQFYLPTRNQFLPLRAFSDWQEEVPRQEFGNLHLLAELREAWKLGCHIDLEAYQAMVVANARELTIDARPEEKTGDLILRPVLEGDFPRINPEEIESRFSQFQSQSPVMALRVERTVVILNSTQTAQARAVVARGRVPKSEVSAFERNPAEWLAEHVFPDVETEFSPRVTGIGAWKEGYLGAAWEKAEDWFGKQPESESTKSNGEPSGPTDGGGGRNPNEEIFPKKDVRLVPLIIPNDEDLGFGWRFSELLETNKLAFSPNFSRFARKPMPHQEEAVRWLLGHSKRALHRRKSDEAQGYGAGALLADDMGLGKTFSTLMFLAEWFGLWRRSTGQEPPAVLIVSPLSLLENWKEEISKSYAHNDVVFTRVLLAQADADLNKVRRFPGSRDIAVPGQVTQYGIGFGDGTEQSIDLPGSCVLTTYQTLRDYRFSFAKAEWSAAIFDEAQNIKNPNALQTISAKALKALFRLMLTGTPVENHLGDFWSIFDAAEPGPLGSFVEFRRDWIVPMSRDRDRAMEIGRRLRAHVGGLMLRRLKEEQLTGLPKKMVENIEVAFTEEQLQQYDAALQGARGDSIPESEEGNKRQNRQLAALWQLRQISLHPDLLGGGTISRANSPGGSRSVLQRSGKLAWLLDMLLDIKHRDEKALIFCVQKRLQEGLAHHLSRIFDISVPVVNGDTEATSVKHPEVTRLGLINEWSSRPGFGVCVLSPIAAGAGLNIVAANHVIHLERHWNPAKEDQATDRAYRIGQIRTVTVYLPIGVHPTLESFDSVLNRLLEKKRGLQSVLGLVPPDPVSAPDLMGAIFGSDRRGPFQEKPLDLPAALRLSWRLFESLVAVIYERDAKRVILTPGGSDHGCDVVVLGWGQAQENLLIQCKSTRHDELDSEYAVREVEGARPYYENSLNVIFHRRCLHTTAATFSRRTRQGGDLCKVTMLGRPWLTDALLNQPVTLDEVLRRDCARESI